MGQIQYGGSSLKSGQITDAKENQLGQFALAEDDFGDYSAWTGTAATAGTAANATPGLLIDAASTTADQGYQIQRTKFGVTPKAGATITFKTILKLTSPTTAQFFAGLASVDTTVFSAGENSTANHIGFEMNATSIAATPGVCKFVTENAGTRTTMSTNPLTFTSGTVYDLAFVVTGVSRIDVYVNGTLISSVTTNIAAGAVLVPTFVCQVEATTAPTLTILRHQTLVEYDETLVSSLGNRLMV